MAHWTDEYELTTRTRNILEEGELEEAATVKENLTVQTEGKRYIESAECGMENMDGNKICVFWM